MEESTNIQSPEPIATKPPRVRSVSYPSNTLAHCFELTKRIHQIFGNTTYTDRKSLVSQLKISDSHLQTQLSSAGQYLLLELKSGEGYKPSALFTKIYKPLSEQERREALIECFKGPEVYKKLIEQFEGNELPLEGGLSTILYRNYKIAENASLTAAKVFLENVNELELNVNGTFLVSKGAGKDNDEIPFVDLEKDKDTGDVKFLPPADQNAKPPDNGKDNNFINTLMDMPLIPILLDGDRVAHLYMPKGYTAADFKRVSKVINAYLPD